MPSGVSGDMLLSSLLGICGEEVLPAFTKALNDFVNADFQITLTTKKEKGLVCNQIKFPFAQDSDWSAIESSNQHGRHLSTIEKLLDQSRLDPYIVEESKKVFRILGEAEAYVHGVDIEKIHFHEVGALDSICDVVGFFWLLHHLRVKKVYCSHFTVGMGTVLCAHGEMPVPVPAVVRLLENFSSPVVRILGATGELTTPTGCAILLSCGDFETIPKIFHYKKSAFGLGQKIIPGKFNAVRTSLVTILKNNMQEETIVHITTNIDNDTPEMLSELCQKLFCEKALDVWQETILMKKSRVGVQINVLCDLAEKENMIMTILKNSSSLGCRYQMISRRILSRKQVSFLYKNKEIRAKIHKNVDGENKIRIEHDSVVEFCQNSTDSYKEVLQNLQTAAEILLNKGDFGSI